MEGDKYSSFSVQEAGLETNIILDHSLAKNFYQKEISPEIVNILQGTGRNIVQEHFEKEIQAGGFLRKVTEFDVYTLKDKENAEGKHTKLLDHISLYKHIGNGGNNAYLLMDDKSRTNLFERGEPINYVLGNLVQGDEKTQKVLIDLWKNWFEIVSPSPN